jgi:hypothetical protein
MPGTQYGNTWGFTRHSSCHCHGPWARVLPCRSRQRQCPAAAGEPGEVLLPERDPGPGRRLGRPSCGTGELRPAAVPLRQRGRQVVGGPVQRQVRDLGVPRQPLLPVRPEQLVQSEPMPGQRHGRVCGGDVVRLLRRAPAEVWPDLAQQGAIPGPGSAAAATWQLDLSRRRVRRSFTTWLTPTSDPMRASPGSWCPLMMPAGVTKQLCQSAQYLLP